MWMWVTSCTLMQCVPSRFWLYNYMVHVFLCEMFTARKIACHWKSHWFPSGIPGLPACMCMSVCLSEYLPVCLCLPVYLRACSLVYFRLTRFPAFLVCMPICLSACLLVCLPAFLTGCLPVCLFANTHQPAIIPTSPPSSACLHPWLRLPACLSVCLPVRLLAGASLRFQPVRLSASRSNELTADICINAGLDILASTLLALKGMFTLSQDTRLYRYRIAPHLWLKKPLNSIYYPRLRSIPRHNINNHFDFFLIEETIYYLNTFNYRNAETISRRKV